MSATQAPVADKLLYRPREVAVMTSTSLRWIYQQIESGRLRAVRLSDRVTRIHRDELQKLINAAEAQ